jgi:hypothetical protein
MAPTATQRNMALGGMLLSSLLYWYSFLLLMPDCDGLSCPITRRKIISLLVSLVIMTLAWVRIIYIV